MADTGTNSGAKHTPRTEKPRGRRKTAIGYVVSDKMQKTIVVELEDRKMHPLYGKIIRTTKKVKAHDENGDAGIGDRVIEIVAAHAIETAERQTFRIGQRLPRELEQHVAVELEIMAKLGLPGKAAAEIGEAGAVVHLAAGMPANERMDWLVEKATELGVASITPLVAERSVLKLKGERAEKKLAHWQAVAVAACEQCGRNRVPVVHDAVDLAGWLRAQAPLPAQGTRLLLSLRTGTQALRTAAAGGGALIFLSGPEGGLSSTEEDLALAHGFAPVTLGPRVLRAETAPLAALAALTLQ